MRDSIDTLAKRLRPHYSRFLGQLDGAILMTGHSHQAWPDVTREGQIEAWDDAARWIDRKWSRVFDQILPGFQARVAQRLGTARPADLTLGTSTHELLVRFASCFPDPPSVVTTDGEFHSLRRQIVAWGEAGARTAAVPIRGPHFAERFLAEVDRVGPNWAALSRVLFLDAQIVPEFRAVLDGLAFRRVPVLVDAYHAFNTLALEVDTWPGQVFVVAGGYKYAQMGEGCCFMLSPQNIEAFRPRLTGWFADFGDLDTEVPSARLGYGPGGQRFLGATFDPTSLYRGYRALQFLDEEGLDVPTLRAQSIAQTERIITHFDQLGLSQLGLQLLSPRVSAERGGFVSFDHAEARRLSSILADRGVRADARGRALRFGPAPYTTCPEIDRAVAVLGEILG